MNEVHRLIENEGYRFGLTGSSARKLRKQGTNLLAGRARTLSMHPLTATELGDDFNLMKSLNSGHLPEALLSQDASHYLKSYVGTYLREEIQQEAFVRNLKQFADFLEMAAFSQAAVLTVTNIAKDCGIDRKTANNYFELLEDLLIAYRLPAFQRRAKRKLTSHPKFFYFDVGLYRALRKRGPLDPIEEIEGPAIETLVAQEIRATNANFELGYDVSFWRSASQHEVDFVLYGERGFIAIEVKRSSTFRKSDLENLQLFQSDYPEAKAFLVYLGDKAYVLDGIRVEPLNSFLKNLPAFISL